VQIFNTLFHLKMRVQIRITLSQPIPDKELLRHFPNWFRTVSEKLNPFWQSVNLIN